MRYQPTRASAAAGPGFHSLVALHYTNLSIYLGQVPVVCVEVFLEDRKPRFSIV